MVDATWPSISSAVDETVANLNELHGLLLRRQEASRAHLDGLVERLGESSVPWPEESPADPTGAFGPGKSDRTEPRPYVHLPERTTPGGSWGPKVRAKLIAEALARR